MGILLGRTEPGPKPAGSLTNSFVGAPVPWVGKTVPGGFVLGRTVSGDNAGEEVIAPSGEVVLEDAEG